VLPTEAITIREITFQFFRNMILLSFATISQTLRLSRIEGSGIKALLGSLYQ
jgi:hypothetical protein